MRELEGVDRQIGTLAHAAATAPRPYRLVVLSDHGQSLGPTFRDRTGLGLDELVAGLMAGNPSVGSAMTDVESYGRLNTLLTSIVRTPGLTGRTARRALKARTADDVVEVGPGAAERRPAPAEAASTFATEPPAFQIGLFMHSGDKATRLEAAALADVNGDGAPFS